MLSYTLKKSLLENYFLYKRKISIRFLDNEYIETINFIALILFESNNIEAIEKNLKDKRNVLLSYKQEFKSFFIIIEQYISNLLEKTDNYTSFNNKDFSEVSFLTKLNKDEQKDFLVYFYILKLKICYIFDDFDYSIKIIDFILKNIHYCYSDFFLLEFYFYYTLVVFKFFYEFTDTKKTIEKNITIIEQLENNENYLKILNAIKNAYFNNNIQKIDVYYKLWDEISKNSNRIHKGIIRELIAQTYFENNNNKNAIDMINKAYKHYHKYGFLSKLSFIAKKYDLKKIKYTTTIEILLKNINYYNSTLPFESQIKTLFSYIGKMIGSKKIFLITSTNKNLIIEECENGFFSKLDCILYDNKSPLSFFEVDPDTFAPIKAISNTIKDRELLVITNVNKSDFYSESYIFKNNLTLTISIPIFLQGDLIGIVHIENCEKDIHEYYNFLYLLFFILVVSIQHQTLKKGINTLDELIKRKKDTINSLILQRDQQIEITQKNFAESAHKAGMADFATGVIHNIGNILNSLNISNQIVTEMIEKSKIIGFFKANMILEENINDLDNFIAKNKKAKKLFEYYLSIGKTISNEITFLKKELKSMDDKIILIKNVIVEQQNSAKNVFHTELASLSSIVEDALSFMIPLITKNNIEVIKTYSDIEKVPVQKTKLLNIIINLIKNSNEALHKNNENNRKITIKVSKKENIPYIKISDNGEGIAYNNLDKVFNHSFTTKSTGYGFGLHTCANSMTEMGGKIVAESNGLSEGASFTLWFENYLI